MKGHNSLNIKINFVLVTKHHDIKITVEKANQLIESGEYYPMEDNITFSTESLIKYYNYPNEITIYLEKVTEENSYIRKRF